jgi:hypothetical protein
MTWAVARWRAIAEITLNEADGACIGEAGGHERGCEGSARRVRIA